MNLVLNTPLPSPLNFLTPNQQGVNVRNHEPPTILSGVLLQSSELHCQIAKLMNQLEAGEGERRLLEADYLHTQQQNQLTLSEKEGKWSQLLASYQSKCGCGLSERHSLSRGKI